MMFLDEDIPLHGPVPEGQPFDAVLESRGGLAVAPDQRGRGLRALAPEGKEAP